MSLKIRAFAIHLLVSFFFLALSALWVFLVWYPFPLNLAVGVDSIFLLAAFCDAILGPVMTLIIYKERKKNLKLDLAIIGAIQISALFFGIWTMADARPVWLVFNVDRFDLVQAYELDLRYFGEVRSDFKSLPKMGPRWAASRSPADSQKRNELLMESVMGGSDLPQRIDLYVDINEEQRNILEKSFPLKELKKNNSEKEIKKELTLWPQAKRWLPLMTKKQPMVVLLDGSSRPISVVNLKPWS